MQAAQDFLSGVKGPKLQMYADVRQFSILTDGYKEEILFSCPGALGS